MKFSNIGGNPRKKKTNEETPVEETPTKEESK